MLPFPQATALAPDDISSIVAFDGKIGVMWSDQGDPLVEAFQFATHVDGTADTQWTLTTASSGDHAADDHINLKALSGDPSGRVFAATKTSRTAAGDTLQQLLVLAPDGTWTQHPYGTVAENQTRSQVMIDTEHRELYMFVSAPCCSGGTITYKATSLASPSFAPGPGTPLIQLPTSPMINNPSSTKQPLSSSTGLVVLGGDDSTASYVHGALGLGPDTRAPDTRIAAGAPSGTTATTGRFVFASDEAAVRFECSLDGGAFAACATPGARQRPRAGRPPLRGARDRLGGQRRRDARDGVVDHAGGAGNGAGNGAGRHDPSGRRGRATGRAPAAHRARPPAPRPPRARARRGDLPRHVPRRRARAGPGRRDAPCGPPGACRPDRRGRPAPRPSRAFVRRAACSRAGASCAPRSR